MTIPYHSSPVFTDETLPAALRTRHSTKAGVWAIIRVIRGKVRLTCIEPSTETILDSPATALVMPEQPHFVTPLGSMALQVDFYDQPPDG